MTAERKRTELPQAGGTAVNDSPVGCQSHRPREKRACSAAQARNAEAVFNQRLRKEKLNPPLLPSPDGRSIPAHESAPQVIKGTDPALIFLIENRSMVYIILWKEGFYAFGQTR